jgi:hypothetical protein
MIVMLGLLAGCKSAPENKTITGPQTQLSVSMEARPSAVPANGSSRIVVFTQVSSDGVPASDSTQVILLNTIGTLKHGTLYTLNGIALDTLVSDTMAGSGWIIAYARGARDSVEVMFTQ